MFWIGPATAFSLEKPQQIVQPIFLSPARFQKAQDFPSQAFSSFLL